MIYFIQAGDGDIKIGFTNADSAAKRLATFQTGHSKQLRLLGTIPGDMKDEKAIHRELDAYRTHGEWFRPALELTDVISRMIQDQSPWWRIREVNTRRLDIEWNEQIVERMRWADKYAYIDYPAKPQEQIFQFLDLMRHKSALCRQGLLTKEAHRAEIIPLSAKVTKLQKELASL